MKMKAQWDLSDHLLRFVLLCFRFVNEDDGFRRHFRTWGWNLQGLFRFFLGVLRLLVVRGRLEGGGGGGVRCDFENITCEIGEL